MQNQKPRGYEAQPQLMQQLGSGKREYPAKQGDPHPHQSDLPQSSESKPAAQSGTGHSPKFKPKGGRRNADMDS